MPRKKQEPKESSVEEVKEAPKTKKVKTETKTEVFTQNGKPYKKVTWTNGVPTIEWL